MKLASHVVFVLICALAALSETTSFQARRYAFAAQVSATTPDHVQTLEWTRRALAWDADNFQARYIRAAKFKATGQSGELRALLPRLLAEHPNQASVRRLAGEEAYLRRDYAEAGNLLWEAMAINPSPPTSPSNFWRMTMMASALAGKQPQALAAATRALALAPADAFLKPPDRRGLLLDTAEVFKQAGWNSASEEAKKLAENLREGKNLTQ